MGKFENHLWTEFVREHGDAMARASRPAVTHAHRRRGCRRTGLGLVGASAAVALVLAATSTSPAFAVTETVTARSRSRSSGQRNRRGERKVAPAWDQSEGGVAGAV